VFRDQLFSGDMGSHAVKRIEVPKSTSLVENEFRMTWRIVEKRFSMRRVFRLSVTRQFLRLLSAPFSNV